MPTTSTAPTTRIRIIKKYQNRRLYDTDDSIYITLTEVKDLVLDGVPFEVLDAKTGENLTRQVLLSIILEEEAGGVPIFTNDLLRQVISFYGHTHQSAFGRYLEDGIRSFSAMQASFQEQLRNFFPEGTSHTQDKYTKFMNLQSPMMQNIFGGYVDQSRKLMDVFANAWAMKPSKDMASDSNKNSEPKEDDQEKTMPQKQMPASQKTKPTKSQDLFTKTQAKEPSPSISKEDIAKLFKK